MLHLIAMAHACGLTLTLDDFQRVSDRVPFIADLKPSGKYVMEDVHKVRAGWAAGGSQPAVEEQAVEKRGRQQAACTARLSCSCYAGAPQQHTTNHPPLCASLQVGGTPAILKYLHERNLVDGSCLTVTGKTLAENVAGCPSLKEGQQVSQTGSCS